MEWFQIAFGEGTELIWYQMVLRGCVIFIATLCMLRIAGTRTFGQKSAIDYVILITLGSVLSRAIVGASPMIPVLCASFAIALLHRILVWISFYSQRIGAWVKGGNVVLFKNGKKDKKAMHRTLISDHDLEEHLRLETHSRKLDDIEEVVLERSGELSFIKKDTTKS